MLFTVFTIPLSHLVRMECFLTIIPSSFHPTGEQDCPVPCKPWWTCWGNRGHGTPHGHSAWDRLQRSWLLRIQWWLHWFWTQWGTPWNNEWYPCALMRYTIGGFYLVIGFVVLQHMREELIFSISLAGGCVVAMTLVLLASPIMAIYIGICITMVLVGQSAFKILPLGFMESIDPPSIPIDLQIDMLGAMYYWGLTLDSVTSLMMIQSLGFTVDYCVHISEAFMGEAGSRNGQPPSFQLLTPDSLDDSWLIPERLGNNNVLSFSERKRKCLSHMGPAVWYGGLATFFILLPVFGAQSYIYQCFYKVWTLWFP